MPVLVAEAATVDFTLVSQVADAVVTTVGKVATMITANPILFLGIGIGMFYGGVRIVRSMTSI